MVDLPRKPVPGEVWRFGSDREAGLVLAIRGTGVQGQDAVTVLSRPSVWKGMVADVWGTAFSRRVDRRIGAR